MSDSRKRSHVKPRTSQTRAHWYHPAIKSDARSSRAQVTTPPESPERGRARERQRRREEDRRLPQVEWTWAVIGMAMAGVVGVIALLLLVTTSGGASPTVGEAATAAALNQETPTGVSMQPVSVDVLPTVEIKNFNGTRRVTVLLMGLDKRPGERGTGFRSDTMMLLSLDPITNRLSMLSIPRDIQVPIPLPGETDLRPINTAYVLGELHRPGYGPKLAAETVQYNLGIPIDYYVVVSFETVIQLVDAIGGITINVETEIVDDQYPDMYTYGYDPLYIPAGRIDMNGELALKYARTRHQTSDFDRAKRQQQVILAMREKVTNPEMLVSLVPRIPQIWDEVSKGIITDIPFDQMLSIAWYVKDIALDNLHRGSVDGKYILVVNQGGVGVMTINRNEIANLMIEVFGENYNH